MTRKNEERDERPGINPAAKEVQISSLNFSVSLSSEDPKDTIQSLSDVAVRLLRFMMEAEVE